MEPNALISTADGSHSLLSGKYQATYHSHHGAIQESKHVFIEAGLWYQINRNEPLHILELGLGTGLNVFMSYLECSARSIDTHYTALETQPISWQVAQQFNYIDLLLATQSASIFKNIHQGAFDEWLDLSSSFRFRKIRQDARLFFSKEKYSLVYYDAFAPETQPELWTEEIFQRIYDIMLPNAILVTYCAKGVVKRRLKSAGFKVEALPGPPGKREMTRAVKE